MIERNSLAFLMLCAWNNTDPRQAPPEWWFHPSDANRLAWERVAKAALDWLTMGQVPDGYLEPDGGESRPASGVDNETRSEERK